MRHDRENMSSILRKVEKITEVAESVLKEKDVGKVVDFIDLSPENVFVLSIVAPADVKLANQIVAEYKKKHPNCCMDDMIFSAVNMVLDGGDTYYEKRRKNLREERNKIEENRKKLRECLEVAKKRRMNAYLVGDEEGVKKQDLVIADINSLRNIDDGMGRAWKNDFLYSSKIKELREQKSSFAAFLLRSLNSPDAEVLSKEDLLSLCSQGIRDTFIYGQGVSGKSEEDLRKFDASHMEGYLDLIDPAYLIEGVTKCVDSCVLPQNIENYDFLGEGAVVQRANMSPLYRHLATKYSEWLLREQKPGFCVMDDFLPTSYLVNWDLVYTNDRENAKAIFSTLKTSSDIQNWIESFDKIPLDDFLGKVPGLKVDIEDSTSQVFAPAEAALKYAQCREKYFPEQSVEECLSKTSGLCCPEYRRDSMDNMAIAYVLNKIVKSETPEQNKQRSFTKIRDNDGGR